MGEAKRRGPFESRQRDAWLRQEQERQLKLTQRLMAEANKTPQERAAEAERRRHTQEMGLLLAQMDILTQGLLKKGTP